MEVALQLIQKKRLEVHIQTTNVGATERAVELGSWMHSHIHSTNSRVVPKILFCHLKRKQQ